MADYRVFDGPPPRRVTDAPKLNLNVTKQTSVVFGPSFTLAELREFVKACETLKPTAKVTVTKYESRDQRDSTTTTITVNDA